MGASSGLNEDKRSDMWEQEADSDSKATEEKKELSHDNTRLPGSTTRLTATTPFFSRERDIAHRGRKGTLLRSTPQFGC